MIINPLKCEHCDEELQPEDIMICIEDGDLIRVCRFCGNKVSVEDLLKYTHMDNAQVSCIYTEQLKELLKEVQGEGK